MSLLVSLQSDLGKKVLKDVSRSFYLSLRFLPEGFREPASVGYLLARASDTIADAGELSVDQRKDFLSCFMRVVQEGGDFESPMMEGLEAGEEVLMRRLKECFRALNQLPESQKGAVQKVLRIITRGQAWDLERFEGAGVVSLESDEELGNYTYEVAGCVGEFWTEIGYEVEEEFAWRPFEEMMELGRAYGRSLQLINILRDVPEDLGNGRGYLPGVETAEGVMRERQRWIVKAREGLEQGMVYAESLQGRRMRFGTVLPALIGHETLNRLERASWEEWERGVKVSRKEVYGMMWEAMKIAL